MNFQKRWLNDHPRSREKSAVRFVSSQIPASDSKLPPTFVASMPRRAPVLALLLASCFLGTLSLQLPLPTRTGAPISAIAPALTSGYANGRALRRALQIPAQSSGAGDVRAACTAAAVQALVLAGTADSVSQSLHGSVDYCHAGAMAVTAAALSGACNAAWLRKLEDTWPGTGTRAVVSKSLADFYVCAPPVVSGYLVCVPLLTLLFGGASLDAVAPLNFGWTQEGFTCAMLLNLCTFQPYNLLQFSCVPPSLRPLGGACVSAASTVLLSGITLGYTL